MITLALKYFTLNKEEKKKLKKEFYATSFGQTLNVRLIRLLITGSLGILFSIYLFTNYANNWDIVTGIFLCSLSIIFVMSTFVIRITKINNYLVNKKKK